jgi:hypothetical protein
MWRTAGSAALLFFATLAHPFATLLAGIALLIREWDNLNRRRTWIQFALISVPTVALLLSHQFSVIGEVNQFPKPQPLAEEDWWYSFGSNILPNSHLTPLASLTAISRWELPIRGAAFLLLLWSTVRGLRSAKNRNRFSSRLLICFVVLEFTIPFGAVDRVYFLPERVLMLVYVSLGLVASPPRWIGSPGRLAAIGLTLCGCLAAAQYRVAKKDSATIAAVIKATDGIPPGSTVAYVTGKLHGAGANYHCEQFLWGFALAHRNIVSSELFADGLTATWGGLGYRMLVYRKDSLAFYNNYNNLSDASQYSEFLAKTAQYDFLLTVDLDDDALGKLRKDMDPFAHHEGVWVFAYKPKKRAVEDSAEGG